MQLLSSPPPDTPDSRMDAFLFLVNHELKTPLTALKAYVELANRRAQKLDAQRTVDVGDNDTFDPLLMMLQRAESQANRLTRLVGELMDAYTFRAEHLAAITEPCNLTDVVQGCVQAQQQNWPDRTIHLKITTRRNKSMLVRGDPARLRQVVTHLLELALSTTSAEQAIDIQVRQQGERVLVNIYQHDARRATSNQISPATEFQASDEAYLATVANTGMEMSLYLSKYIIEQHGGTADVSRDAHHGMTYWFTLPLITNTSKA